MEIRNGRARFTAESLCNVFSTFTLFPLFRFLANIPFLLPLNLNGFTILQLQLINLFTLLPPMETTVWVTSSLNQSTLLTDFFFNFSLLRIEFSSKWKTHTKQKLLLFGVIICTTNSSILKFSTCRKMRLKKIFFRFFIKLRKEQQRTKIICYMVNYSTTYKKKYFIFRKYICTIAHEICTEKELLL